MNRLEEPCGGRVQSTWHGEEAQSEWEYLEALTATQLVTPERASTTVHAKPLFDPKTVSPVGQRAVQPVVPVQLLGA